MEWEAVPKAGYPIRVTGIESSSIVHRGKGKTFIVVTDWGEGGTARVEIDAAVLGLKPGIRAVDYETGKPIATSGNVLTFALKKHDYKTIVVSD